jgi:hypothetical protein
MSNSGILDRVTEWLREKNFIVRNENGRLLVDVQRSEHSVSLPEISIIGSTDYDTIALGFRYDIDDETHKAYMYLSDIEKIAFIERIENMFKTIGVAAAFIPNAGTMQTLMIANQLNIENLKKETFLKTVLDLYTVLTNVIISILQLNKTGKYFDPSKHV